MRGSHGLSGHHHCPFGKMALSLIPNGQLFYGPGHARTYTDIYGEKRPASGVCPGRWWAAEAGHEGARCHEPMDQGITMNSPAIDDIDVRVGGWPGAIAEAFADAVESGRLNLPLPGAGRTRERWAVLADLAEDDLSLARLAEGHADAVAILAELGALQPPAGSRWGVWAAQPPGPGLTASRTDQGWRLDGTKQYCSGAH